MNLRWPRSSIVVYKNFLADSTRKQYDKYLEMYKKFCLDNDKGFPPESGYLSAIIAEFLTQKSKESERPESMLRGIMAALTNYYGISGRVNPISQEIKNLVKALIKVDTVRQAGRTKIMPIEPFKQLFASWGDNEYLSVAQLRQKSITLLAIACMARPSDFAPRVGFFRDQVIFHEEGSATISFFGVKNDADRDGFEVRIEGTELSSTDPVKCLKVYFNKTAHVFSNATNTNRIPVFLSLRPPFQGINAQTVAQVLNSSIIDAGLNPQHFSAKCFRPSAATAAIVTGCDPNSTRVRGRWKNDKVFFSNYVYPVSEKNISESILYSNVKLS